MGWEDYIFVVLLYIALVLAILGIGWSIYFTWKHEGKINVILAIAVIILNGVSSYMIINILRGAWPDVIPILLVGFTSALLIGQVLINKKLRHANKTYSA